MRELKQDERECVNGGIPPLLGAVLAAISHFGARTAVQSAAGRIGLGAASYEAAKYYGTPKVKG